MNGKNYSFCEILENLSMVNTTATLLEMLMEILAEVEKFSMNSCEVSFKAWEKVFMKCIRILPLMSCNKTIRKIIPRK
jgi:hypothetical protein